MSTNNLIRLNPNGFPTSNTIITEKVDYTDGQTSANRIFITGGENNLTSADLELINNISGLLKRLKGIE